MPVELYTCCRCGKDKGEKMTAIGRDANSGRTIYVCQLCLSPEEKMHWWTKIDNPRIEEEIWVGPEDPRYISKHMKEETKEQISVIHHPGKCSVCDAYINYIHNNPNKDENGHNTCLVCQRKLCDAANSPEARQALRMSCSAFAMCAECAKPMYNSPYNNTHGQKVCKRCADVMQGLTKQVSFTPHGEQYNLANQPITDEVCFTPEMEGMTTEEKRDAAALGRQSELGEIIDSKLLNQQIEETIARPTARTETVFEGEIETTIMPSKVEIPTQTKEEMQHEFAHLVSKPMIAEECDKQELNHPPFPPIKVAEIDYKARQKEWRMKLGNAARTIFQMLSWDRNIIVATDKKTARIVSNIQWKHDTKDLMKCKLSIYVGNGIDIDITNTIIREMGTGELIWEGLNFTREDWCGCLPF